MTSPLLSFYEIADEETLGESKPSARPREVTREVTQDHVLPSDRILARYLNQGTARLQDAMDAASKAGLIIEPTFKSISGRFNEFGVSVDSYVCNVELYRKLS